MAAGTAGQYWVTWKDESDPTAARASAIIWGPQATAPAQIAGYFQAGPFATKADAQTYEQSIGTGQIIPSPGTPIVGNVTVSNPLAFLGFLGEIGHWIGVFVTDITDLHLWISLGWLFLGLVLLIIGILLFLKHEDILPDVAPVPVPV